MQPRYPPPGSNQVPNGYQLPPNQGYPPQFMGATPGMMPMPMMAPPVMINMPNSGGQPLHMAPRPPAGIIVGMLTVF
jgi:hypothetical protein